MSRMIDADALIGELHSQFFYDGRDRTRVYAKIQGQPTIEERTGEWIPVDSYTAFGGDEATWYAHGNPIAFYYCSECKEQAYADENGDSLLTNFCPNCGAKMEVDK